ncbi:MAG: prenyltransferase/squalene oxidase repeat-containing protein [Planctomycetota bacterium]
MSRRNRDEAPEDYENPEDAQAQEEEEEAASPSTFSLEGTPSWLVSAGFHTLLLLLLSFIAAAQLQKPAPEAILANIAEPLPPKEPLTENLKPSEIPSRPDVPAKEVTVPTPVILTEKVEISDHVETPNLAAETHDAKGEETNYTLAEAGGPGLGGNTSGDAGDAAGYGVMGVGAGGLGGRGSGGLGSGGGGKGAGVFGLRGQGGQKLAALAGGGGGPMTEAAVERALAWLSKHQEQDGHWDCVKYGGMAKPRENVKLPMGYDVAVTGLATLAFLGAGHTTTSPKYGGVVRKALYWLDEKQNKQTGKWPGSHYGQGIAALAMAEAYGMGCGHQDAAQKAMDYVKFSQNPNGGWNYGTGEAGDDENGKLHGRNRSDTSVSGWQIMAAKSGKIAELKVDSSIFVNAQKYFGSVGMGDYEGGGEAKIFYSLTDGKTAVNKTEGEDAIRSITMLSMLFMGDQGQGPWMQKAADEVKAKGVDLRNFYYLYYGTLTMFQIGGPHWKAWNEMMKDPLIKIQKSGGDDDGSWDPDAMHGPYGGRVYQTALGAMTLEVYYRYLPVLGK